MKPFVEISTFSQAESCLACGQKDFQHFIALKDYFLSKEEFNLFKCLNCGLLITSPQPDMELLPSYYNSSQYISHQAQGISLYKLIYRTARYFSLRRKLKIISRYFKKGSLLDIGAGTGDFLAFLQKNHWNVFGVEPIHQARNAALANYNIDLFKSIDSLNRSINYFEVVTMWHSLEHTYDPAYMFSVVGKALKQNGIMVLALPCYESWDARHYGEYWAAYDVPRHLFHFSVMSVEKLAERNSFQVIERLPLSLDAYYISLLSEKNKTGKRNYFKALYKGYYSNLKAVNSNFSFSSWIYILRKS